MEVLAELLKILYREKEEFIKLEEIKRDFSEIGSLASGQPVAMASTKNLNSNPLPRGHAVAFPGEPVVCYTWDPWRVVLTWLIST